MFWVNLRVSMATNPRVVENRPAFLGHPVFIIYYYIIYIISYIIYYIYISVHLHLIYISDKSIPS